MNKAADGIASLIESVPQDYNIEEFSSLVAELDHAMLAGKLSAPFVLGGLQAILNGSLVKRDFPVWKTLTTPRHERDYSAYAEKLNAAGCMRRSAFRMFYRTERESGGDLDVDLVRVIPSDLGFFQKLNIRRSSLYERALELGLQLPWPEVGLALRLAYLDQPQSEWLTMPTRPIDDPEFSQPRLMRLGNTPYEDGGRGFGGLLGIELIVAEKFVRCDEEFVFIKPRAEPQA
jgi:hypothetical protein